MPAQQPHIITVKATPGARKPRVELDHTETGAPLYKVYVTAPPEDGKANKAVIEALAKHLGLRKSDLRLIKGQTSRTKQIEILS